MGDFAKDVGWVGLGLALLVVAGVVAALAIDPGAKGFAAFAADGSFATLAGFTVLAAVLERVSEAVLAPWWAKTRAQGLKGTAAEAGDVVKAAADRRLLGAADLRKVAAHARAVAADATTSPEAAAKATAAAEAAESEWVKTVRARPTITLPAAAIATVLCAYLHLFLLHGVAKSGVPTTKLAYVTDAILTGLALAGGAKPFHDLVDGIAAKKDAAVEKNATQAAAAP